MNIVLRFNSANSTSIRLFAEWVFFIQRIIGNFFNMVATISYKFKLLL